MSIVASDRRPSQPPARTLRLLANLWLPAAMLCGLSTIALVITTVKSFTALVGGPAAAGAPAEVYAGSVFVSGLAAVIFGRITWRLAVEVPRLVRAWTTAIDDRRQALVG